MISSNLPTAPVPAESPRRSVLSVVLATTDSYSTVRRSLEALGAQTMCASIELVVVVPAGVPMGPVPSGLERFAVARVLQSHEATRLGRMRAEGVLAAASPIVAMAEDHSYPEPDWAEKLVAAYQPDRAAVAPAMVNANPRSAFSWASIYIDFGSSVHPAHSGETTHLPWHNCSYRREALIAFGPRLGELLETEGQLHAELMDNGYRLYLAAEARTQHVNISRPAAFVRAQFYGGRSYAAVRSSQQNWPRGRRWLRAGAEPMVPLLRLARIGRQMVEAHRFGLLLRILPLLVLGLSLHAAGEAAGYALGPGDSAAKKSQFEHDRLRFVGAEIEHERAECVRRPR